MGGTLTKKTDEEQARRHRRRKALAVVLGATAIEAVVVAKRRGSLIGIDTVVRCREGHTFTTYWIPGASLKAIRLGWWRYQRCPVGHHWSLVTPVDALLIDEAEKALAEKRHDIRIP